jgi:hypothetical protein
VTGAGDYSPPVEDLQALAKRALSAGVVGAAASGLGASLDPPQFFRSYLAAWLLWLGVALGCLAVQMLHHLSRGAWGLMIRRILEAASRTLPVLALLFAPLLFGLGDLYEWARPEEVARDHHLQHKVAYLNVPFFLVRVAVSFVVWIALAVVLSRLSAAQDRSADPALERRMRRCAAPGLALYCLTMTFMAVDLLMSLDPHWFSAIYGVYVIGGQAVSAMAITVVAALYLTRREPMAQVLSARHFHDWGKLLLAFTMLWSYFAFSQFLIIWSGDLPEETSFYRDRLGGGWNGVALVLVVFHFALPFVLLLSRELKRSAKKLAAVAVLLLVLRWVDLFWLIQPAFSPQELSAHWLDLAAPVGVGGIWVWRFARELGSRPLLPLNDPGLPAALEVHAHG